MRNATCGEVNHGPPRVESQERHGVPRSRARMDPLKRTRTSLKRGGRDRSTNTLSGPASAVAIGQPARRPLHRQRQGVGRLGHSRTAIVVVRFTGTKSILLNYREGCAKRGSVSCQQGNTVSTRTSACAQPKIPRWSKSAASFYRLPKLGFMPPTFSRPNRGARLLSSLIAS